MLSVTGEDMADDYSVSFGMILTGVPASAVSECDGGGRAGSE